LKDVVSTVGDTAKAALAEKTKSASAANAAQALLESKSAAGEVVVDAELEEIMKVAQEAAALTDTLTTDDDDKEKTA
jgi:hypothetical protein